MTNYQCGILQPIPRQARYLMFSLKQNTSAFGTVQKLAKEVDGDSIVAGFGLSLIQRAFTDQKRP